MLIEHLDHNQVLSILPDRNADAHKGCFGRILLLCGSRGYTGAAALTAMGVLRSGAGLVYLGVPESIYQIEAVKLTEAIVFPLPQRCGMLSRRAVKKILDLLPKMDAVVIGPGLGCSKGTLAVTRAVLQAFKGTIILDADGINLIAKHKDIVRGRMGQTILTPHEGEFARLSDALPEGREAAAVALAKELQAVVVLKGHETVVTDAERCFINTTGNPGMAVGGSGDVLSGVIAGLLGQGIAPLEAAACGVWLHGAAGDACAEQMGQYGMLPTDMLNILPRLLK